MRRPLVIFGSAPCVQDDLARLPDHAWFDFMAVGMNSLDRYAGRIDYIANNHKENISKINAIMMQRHEACGGNTDYKMICFDDGPGVDIVGPCPTGSPSGSSSLTGALAAINMGYQRIILAGCPLGGNAPAGNPYEEFRGGWAIKKNEMLGLVKSLSGWTRDFLGAPCKAWIAPEWDDIRAESRWSFLIAMALRYGWASGAEIGVWYGKTYFEMLMNLPGLNLIGVDIWTDSSEKISHHKDQMENRRAVYAKASNYAGRARIMEMKSSVAALQIKEASLDFVFIDASHTYESVVEDISVWLPRIKPGGFLIGHDYNWESVRLAVHDCLPDASVHEAGSDHLWAWRRL